MSRAKKKSKSTDGTPKSGSRQVSCWPVTYKWVAMGTLVAYTALGASKVILACPPEERDRDKNRTGAQALVVRRFEIEAGTLEEVLNGFAKTTGIHVTFAEEGLKTLASAGVKGLYVPEQALKALLAESGGTYRFTGSDEVTIRLASVTTSVEVKAEAPEMLASSKYTELLRETPQTINVVSQELMLEQGATTLRDALRNVAGISLAAGEGGAQGDNLTIRGFSARNDIFLDGMRDFGSYYRDPFNYSDVDVLQGPTSVTFGRGSTGGVVNQESKTPQAAKFISGTLQFGSDATRRITADVNEPINSTTAFRLNVMGHDSQVADRNIAENRRFGVAPSLEFGLGTTTRLTLSYLHEQSDDNPDYGIPWYFNGPAPVDRQNYYGFQHGNFLRTDVDVATIKVEHDFGGNFSLRNQARYGHDGRDAQITEAKLPTNITLNTPLDQIQVTRNQITVDSLETYLGDQLDLTMRFNTGLARHTMVAGVEGGRETSSPIRSTFAGVPTTSLLHSDDTQTFSGTRSITSVTDVLAISVGAYFVDTIKLGQKWDVIGGIRWDRFDATVNTPVSTAVPPAPQHLAQVDQQPSYRAAIVYKPKDFGSIYFDYGTSFNPSAEALSLSAANFPNGPNSKGLDPEKNRTFEVGSKWDLRNKKLSVAGSAFRTEKVNAREPSQDNPLVNVLAGTQRVDGVQIAVTGRISDRWQVLSSYAYLRGILASSIAFPKAVGAQLANVPANTFNLWTTYQMPWKLTVGAGSQFVDSRTASSTVPLDPTTGLVKRIPSYWVFNAMASHPITENIGVQVNLYNLANRYYFDEPHPAHIVPGAGFTALAGFNFRF